MAVSAVATETPGSPEEAAELLGRLAADERAVRPRGGATKLAWGAPGDPVAVELSTAGLTQIVEHNEGDLTAIVQAGVPLAVAQAAFAEQGQMFAVDPPLGEGDAATVGGVLATNDSGPLRHRYGGVRDLVVGVRLALSDGTLAKAGGKVIKNVAGYDLAKLFTGSHGTLGLVAELSVRLHPLPAATATARGTAEDPGRLADALLAITALPLEADSLDLRWEDAAGTLLIRFGGAAAEAQAEAAAPRLREAGLAGVDTVADDDELWAAQRAGQRSATGAVLKVAARPSDTAALLRSASETGARVVARGAHGLAWVTLEGDDLAGRVQRMRAALAPRACTLLDAPDDVRGAVDPWPAVEPGTLALMRRVKERFDPARIFRPGAFVGGL